MAKGNFKVAKKQTVKCQEFCFVKLICEFQGGIF